MAISEVEVVVATMNDVKPVCLNALMSLPQNVLITVVNQCDREGTETLDGVNWIHTTSRGLSMSRNIGLAKSRADLCLISDNDVYINFARLGFVAGLLDTDTFACVICNNISDFGFKATKIQKLGYRECLKVCSWQIIVNKRLVGGIRFDENFGLGSGQYNSGEENIFLTDVLSRGGSIIALPSELIDHADAGTGWIFDEKFYDDRIAVLRRIFGPIGGSLMYILFIFKKKIEVDGVFIGRGLSRLLAFYFRRWDR